MQSIQFKGLNEKVNQINNIDIFSKINKSKQLSNKYNLYNISLTAPKNNFFINLEYYNNKENEKKENTVVKSIGNFGFKKSNRTSNFAKKVFFKKITEFFKKSENYVGILNYTGKKKDIKNLKRIFQVKNLKIIVVKDKSKKAFNGCRLKKVRRL